MNTSTRKLICVWKQDLLATHNSTSNGNRNGNKPENSNTKTAILNMRSHMIVGCIVHIKCHTLKKNTPAKPLLLYARWFHAIANFINNLTRTTHNQFGFMTLLSSIIRLNWHFLRKYQRLGLIITKMQKIGIYRLLLLLNKKLYHELQITVNEEKRTHNPKET